LSASINEHRPRLSLFWRLLAAAVVGIAAGLLLTRAATSSEYRATGLPRTSDYHSLLVAPNDPRRLLLGTHQGLFGSSDGGRTWRKAGLSGQDAMNLARPSGQTLWVAGHNVLAKSTDSGLTWTDVRPEGLPSLDIHGFALDREHPGRLYAAVAGEGLYRSRNNGRSFSLISREVGGAVFGLGVLPDGRIFAADLKQGLLVSGDGGRSWRLSLHEQLLGLAVNPRTPGRLLAAGRGIFLSENGGRSWRRVFEIPEPFGPVAWSTSRPNLAYAVGYDRALYQSTDGGRSWQSVS
jgi:photosystem II stability/assembly factor-like uncharacterized protein